MLQIIPDIGLQATKQFEPLQGLVTELHQIPSDLPNRTMQIMASLVSQDPK